MANDTIGGFKVVKTGNRKSPIIREYDVATGYGTAIFNGDLVIQVSGGTAEAAAAGSTTILGVCIGAFYWNGSVMTKGRYLPASTAWGTNQSRRSRILVEIITPDTILEADCDDGVTATTYAGFVAFLGENCDITATAGSTINGQSGHCIDISTHVATAAQVRLQQIPNFEFQDFASSRVKLWCSVNESHLYTPAGI